MKPAPFDYLAPSSVDAAIEALVAANGEGRVLAGGQSLMPLMNFRMVRPAILVDINRIKSLSFIEPRGDSIVIGALTRHRALEHSPLIAEKLPMIKAAMHHVAHVAIRNRGTIGGSLSHADPAAELPMLALFYDATIVAQGTSGRRRIVARDFFIDALTTCLEPEEIVVEIEFPLLAQGGGWGFEEVARRSGDFALACVAVAIRRTGEALDELRAAAMGVSDTPLRLTAVEQQLRGAAIDAALPERFAQLVASSVAPNSDIHASAEYRRHLVGVLAKRALTAALAAKA